MGVDAYGNYQATITPVWTPASGIIITGSIGRGSGAPDATTPLWLLAYIDSDTGALYINQDGTTSGWILVSAPTAVQEGFSGSGDPAVSPVATTAFYVDTDDGTIWFWYNGAWH